ncbi:hypothetical protein BDV10DRAFT_173479 [Aspergillus recurvatus]
MADLRAGAELLRTQVQTHARGLADYIASLEAWRGICMICYHLPRVGSGQSAHARHTFRSCPNPQRFRYLDAKRRATGQAREEPRGTLFQRFRACWMCYNPQVVCDRQRQSPCEFPDIVLPACWAVFQKRPWVEQYLGMLGGCQVADSEERYMLWLGEEREVFGELAFNALAVVDLVLRQMEGG